MRHRKKRNRVHIWRARRVQRAGRDVVRKGRVGSEGACPTLRFDDLVWQRDRESYWLAADLLGVGWRGGGD